MAEKQRYSAPFFCSPPRQGTDLYALYRERSSKSKHFLYAPAIPVGENAGERIIAYLNEDPVFESVMLDYIDEAAKHRRDN